MKPIVLCLLSLAAGAAWSAKPTPVPTPRPVVQSAPAHSTFSLPRPGYGDPAGVKIRHLSQEERAELREQLYQFNRSAAAPQKVSRSP